MPDNDCNSDDQMQKAVAAELFLLLDASQCYIPLQTLSLLTMLKHI